MSAEPSIFIRRPRLHLPSVGGVIERRILVNFRCEPKALAQILPPPFRPKFVRGWGMAGICLIRLGSIKPAFIPGDFGFNSENAAHRIAVEWDENGKTREGVFIPRRDTNSLLNRIAGGKFFPGIHHPATFQVCETTESFKLEMQSRDDKTFVRIRARLTDELPRDSIFQSLTEASEFFQGGALGWSARAKANEFDGLELNCRDWKMEPLKVDLVESSFFGDQKYFLPGSAKFDSAFLMRNIAHEWHARGQLRIFGGATL